MIGEDPPGPVSDRDRLRRALEAEGKDGPAPLWLVLIGHGTFDGQEAKFNLRGPDFTATELALWLRPFHRPLAIVDTLVRERPLPEQAVGRRGGSSSPRPAAATSRTTRASATFSPRR